MAAGKLRKIIKGVHIGMRGKLIMSLGAIAAVLLLSSVISVMEYSKMSSYVSDLISKDINSINDSRRLGEAAEEYNLAILAAIGDGSVTELPDFDTQGFMRKCDSLSTAFSSTSALADSVKYSYAAYMLTSLELGYVIKSDFINTRDWYFDRLQPRFGRLRKDIDKLSLAIYDDLRFNSENMDSSPERRERYINVIMKKCDEVSKVTDDMFIHSLHDLDRLVINKDKVALDKVINETIESLKGDKDDIDVKGEIDEFTLNEGDSMRIAQVIENIITNARKYAEGSRIEVWSEIKEQDNTGESKVSGSGVDGSFAASYCLHIKDNGPGIPPEDLPFIFDKFYRGKNKSDKSGAGLGLFIVKYIMEAMGGKVELNNSRDGLEVMLAFYN